MDFSFLNLQQTHVRLTHLIQTHFKPNFLKRFTIGASLATCLFAPQHLLAQQTSQDPYHWMTCDKALSESQQSWYKPDSSDPDSWNYKITAKLAYCNNPQTMTSEVDPDPGISCNKAATDVQANWYNPNETDPGNWNYRIREKHAYCTGNTDTENDVVIDEPIASHTDPDPGVSCERAAQDIQADWYREDETDPSNWNYRIREKNAYCISLLDDDPIQEEPNPPEPIDEEPVEQEPTEEPPVAGSDPEPGISCEKAQQDSQQSWYRPNETDPSDWNYRITQKLIYCSGEVTNSAPQAVASASSYAAIIGDEITLSGEQSSDPNGDYLYYDWQIIQQPSQSNAELDSWEIANPRFVVDMAGQYRIQLIVNDGDLSSIASTVSIAVAEPQPDTGTVVMSGGNNALRYSISELSNNGVLTLTTNGSYQFGNTPPKPTILIDAAQTNGGTIALDEIDSANSQLNYHDAQKPFYVDSVPQMPGGKAYRVGSLGEEQNSWRYAQLISSHEATNQIYEQRTIFWPEQHQRNAEKYFDSNNRWQYKTIWNMHDRHFGGDATNFFFITRFHNFDNRNLTFTKAVAISSNVVGTTKYFAYRQDLNNYDDPYLRPYVTPYTLETHWNTGTFGANNGRIEASGSIIGKGPLSREVRTGLQLLHPTNNTPVTSFHYPGYVRGFSIPNNTHLYEADMYRAIGPCASCRVAITDNAEYHQSEKRTVLWPIHWSNNKIDVKLRGGWFGLQQLSGKYINILDHNNNQIASVRIQ